MADQLQQLTSIEGIALSGEESGEGRPIVLLHGLSATRRYVVMGSRALERGATASSPTTRAAMAAPPRPGAVHTAMST